jgi:ABC-type sugar transport system permease subunit
MALAAAPRVLTESSRALQRIVPWRILFLLPGALLYVLFVLWPLADVAGTGLSAGGSGFAALWADPYFHQSLGNTVVWEAAALLLPTVLALGIALLLRVRRVALFLAVLFFPALLPPTVVTAVWVLIYSPVSGLLNLLLGDAGLGTPDWLGDPHLALGALFVAWLWSALGVGVLIYWAALSSISREWFEIALVEGAGPVWRFRHVIVPGIRRALVLVLVVNAALAAQVFDIIFTTTGGGPGYATMLLPLEIYARTFGGFQGQGATAATLQIGLGIVLAAVVLLSMRRPEESLLAASEPYRPRPSLPTGITLSAVAALVLLPLLWLIPVSLQPGRSFAINGISFDVRTWVMSNFAAVWDAGMGGATLTSLLLAAAVVAGTLILAVPAAFALSYRAPRPWQVAALALLLAGLFQPTLAILFPLFTLLNTAALLGSAWGIILPEIARALPFAVLALWGFLEQAPGEVLEAAEIDGASPWRQMRSIALPLVRPALIAVAIWSFITSWNEYLLPTVNSQDGSIQTVPMLLAGFIGKYDTQIGPLAAGALLALLPSLLIYLLLRRPAAAGLAEAERSLQ